MPFSQERGIFYFQVIVMLIWHFFSDTLFCKKATVEWRHEIDCLLKFVFYDRGLDFNIGNVAYLEAALLYNPNQAKVIFTDKGRCVGWALGNEIRLHPDYDETKIQWID